MKLSLAFAAVAALVVTSAAAPASADPFAPMMAHAMNIPAPPPLIHHPTPYVVAVVSPPMYLQTLNQMQQLQTLNQMRTNAAANPAHALTIAQTWLRTQGLRIFR